MRISSVNRSRSGVDATEGDPGWPTVDRAGAGTVFLPRFWYDDDLLFRIDRKIFYIEVSRSKCDMSSNIAEVELDESQLEAVNEDDVDITDESDDDEDVPVAASYSSYCTECSHCSITDF